MPRSREQSTPEHAFSPGPILLVTATPTETTALHSKLKPRSGFDEIEKVHIDPHIYYQARLGNADVIHTQCFMGSSTPGGSILTVSHAIARWKPCAVIMVGIAFGIDEENRQ